MLQPTLAKRVASSISALNAATPLSDVLNALEAAYQQMEGYLLGIAEGGAKLNESANAVHTTLASLSSVTKSISPRKLFRDIELLEVQLSDAWGEGMNERKHIAELLVKLDEFAEAYNTYVTHQIANNSLPLLRAARSLHLTLAVLREFLEHLNINLSEQVDIQPSEAEFSLVLSNISDLQDFAEKLAALHAIYAELCYVLKVSAESHPLRIVKIESGSLWTRLFGDTRVVGLMIALIEGSVRFFHRNYTTEGKIAAIPRKIEALDKILEFTNKLKESGIEVTELQDSLAKNAVVITDSLNTLVSNQPVVEVNGQVLSVSHEIYKAVLEQTRTKQIAYESPTNSTPKLSPPDIN